MPVYTPYDQILGLANTFTAGPNTFLPATAAAVPVIVQGAAAQSADLLQVQSSAATVLAKITAAGEIDIVSGSAYRYNGVNVVRGLTALNSFFFGNSGNLTMTGANNSAVGVNALNLNTTGGSNAAVGVNALRYNTTGSNNAAVGVSALNLNTTGANNAAVGVSALNLNTTGANNAAVGVSALNLNTTGANNAAVGANAGRSITTGSTNSFLGADAGYNASQLVTATNSMALGYQAFTTASNQVVLGNSSVTETLLRGNTGIGQTAPTSRLHVAGPIATAYAHKIAAYPITATDSIITSDATAGAHAVTLPTAIGCTGRQYTIKRTDASANNTTVATTASQTIDGATTYVLTAQYKFVTVVSDNANWHIIAVN